MNAFRGVLRSSVCVWACMSARTGSSVSMWVCMCDGVFIHCAPDKCNADMISFCPSSNASSKQLGLSRFSLFLCNIKDIIILFLMLWPRLSCRSYSYMHVARTPNRTLCGHAVRWNIQTHSATATVTEWLPFGWEEREATRTMHGYARVLCANVMHLNTERKVQCPSMRNRKSSKKKWTRRTTRSTEHIADIISWYVLQMTQPTTTTLCACGSK